MTEPASVHGRTDPGWLPRALQGTPRFEEVVSPSLGAQIDLGLAAALVARDVYGGLDVWKVLSRLDELAAPLLDAGLTEMPAEAQARALGRHLYERHGFAGNDKDYYDPQNSLLPDVLRRRLGIPISLALVYCEVAKRVGVPARGVGFPGHFLVRIERATPTHENAVFVDPFSNGRILDRSALSSLLSRGTGKRSTLRPEHLEPATPRSTLLRMLSNLKAVYVTRGEIGRALLLADRVLSVIPESAPALRDRGLLAAKGGARAMAQSDLARFLERSPKGEEADVVRKQLAALEHAPSLSH